MGSRLGARSRALPAFSVRTKYTDTVINHYESPRNVGTFCELGRRVMR